MADNDNIGTLALGVTNTGEYGNNFGGFLDADGIITAQFTGTTGELALSFDGFDIDTNTEVEILVNGVSLGFLSQGVNNSTVTYTGTIPASMQMPGVNTISFVNIDSANTWGVTQILLDESPPEDMTLALGVTETGEYGNNPVDEPGVFGVVSDADGVVTAAFTGTSDDLTLNFNAFDVDTAIEIEVFVDNVSLGFLSAGVNQGLSAHSITIPASLQTFGVESVIRFVQDENITFKWGVTDIELVTAPVIPSDQNVGTLVVDTTFVTEEFGNNYNGHNDADGEITANFTGGTTDLELNFDGFDIDTGTEVEVFLNNGTTNVSLGKLAAGTNEALSAYSIAITAAQQGNGVTNTITFKQIDNITFKWGVTNVELVTSAGPPPADMTLVIDNPPSTDEFGNNPVDEPGVFGVVSDADGVVTANFDAGVTPGDLTLNFNAFDVDTAIEIKVLVNGVLHSFLPVGVNQGLSAHSLTITAGQQVGGNNTISFVQNENVTYKWGVTDVELVTAAGDADIGALVVDTTFVTEDFGNKFNGTTDADGEITANFTGGTTDLQLNFDGFDIDTGTEVEVFLNNGTTNVSLGKLAAGTNEALSAYSIAITAAQQGNGVTNTITFKQIDNITYKWGVTNVELVTAAGDADIGALVVDTTFVTEDFGNKFNGTTDADGEITANFTGGTTDLQLNFDGFDIDTGTEVEVFLNNGTTNVSLGKLAAGTNEALSAYSIAITAAQQGNGVTNTITFKQIDNITYKWGVTDIELVTAAGDVDIGALVVDTTFVTEDFGNKFNGTTDADGEITANFTGGTTDLELNFDGFDIDTGTEVEVFLNNGTTNVSLGKLAAGTNEALSAYSIAISAAQQGNGVTNTITFKQIDNITYKWGVTNVELVTPAGPPPADMTLVIGNPASTAEFGNNPVDEPGVFGVNSDADGVVTAEFDAGVTPGDLTLNFNAFDVDTATEIKVLVNGVLHSFLPVGVNQGLSAHSLTITAGQQVAGTNTISFVQNDNIAFKWGVTDVELVTAAADQNIGALVIDTTFVTEDFGNKFNGTTDADGEITANFTGGTTDLVLNFDGFDIDTGTEVEVFLNNGTTNVSLGKLAAGTNEALSAYSIAITAAQQGNGVTNTITFKQIDNITYKWGVTNVELVSPTPPDMTLVIDDPASTLEFGNNPVDEPGVFGVVSDADGVVTAEFTSATTGDQTLNFNAFDVDTETEIKVLVNGVLHSFLPAGVNQGLSAHSLTIAAVAGTNTISFVQNDNITFKWGVTDVSLVTPDVNIGPLTIGGPPVTGEFGNKFNGHNDPDGLITATFTGGTADLLLSFDAFDIDNNIEVEVFLDNGTTNVSLGVLAAGVDDGLSPYDFTILGTEQGVGVTNTITFEQIEDDTFSWGVTNIELDTLV